MDILTILGFVAAVLTTGAGVPQFIKTVRTRHTESLSIHTYIMLALGIPLWIIYGIFKKDLPLTISNFMVLIPVLVILGLKLRNKDHK